MTFRDKTSHVLVRALISHGVVVWLRKTIKHATKRLRECEWFAQNACLFVERENVVASHHARSEGERTFVRFELLSIEPQVVKPTGIRLVEPLEQCRIPELVARNVRVVE